MDIQIKDQLFLITGSTSGLGLGVVTQLVKEGAKILAVARRIEELKKLEKKFPEQFQFICGDITKEETITQITKKIKEQALSGIFVNAGGPPAKSFMETKLEDWDNAYQNLLRWKIQLVKALLPKLKNQNYGRIVFLESMAVKQPVENLILSTSLRAAVVGFAKTLSEEIASYRITVNILAPGYHRTPALKRLFIKKSEQLKITQEEVKKQFEKDTKMGLLGNPNDLGSLACWLLSPHSRFITGQTISIAGGSVKGIMG